MLNPDQTPPLGISASSCWRGLWSKTCSLGKVSTLDQPLQLRLQQNLFAKRSQSFSWSCVSTDSYSNKSATKSCVCHGEFPPAHNSYGAKHWVTFYKRSAMFAACRKTPAQIWLQREEAGENPVKPRKKPGTILNPEIQYKKDTSQIEVKSVFSKADFLLADTVFKKCENEAHGQQTLRERSCWKNQN